MGAIPSGVPGTRHTLNVLRGIVRRWRKSLVIRELAISIVDTVHGKDFAGELNAVFNWVRRNIRYTRDIREVETVATPDKTLEYGQGDCDDMVTLLGSLLEAIGFPVRFVAISQYPDAYSHVYLEAMLPSGQWIAMDPTENQKLGWSPPRYIDRMIVEV